MKKLIAISAALLALTVSCDKNKDEGSDLLCGNGKIDTKETCDKADMNGKTCEDFGFSSGELSCSSDCMQIITAECKNPVADNDSETNDDGQENPSVVINEVVSKTADDSPDWIELKNIGTAQADIAGWIIKDDDDKHIFTIPDSTVIPAGGFIVFEKNSTDGFDFGLDKSGDSVRLYDDKTNEIDSTTWNENVEAGTSWGRIPDGTGVFKKINSPTKGTANSQ